MKIFTIALSITLFFSIYGISQAEASAVSKHLEETVQHTKAGHTDVSVCHTKDITFSKSTLILAKVQCDYECLGRCKDNCKDIDDNSEYNLCLDQCQGFCGCK
ncbi:MAG: hypothetical protein WCK96_11185 [Methylococcales bacterium]